MLPVYLKCFIACSIPFYSIFVAVSDLGQSVGRWRKFTVYIRLRIQFHWFQWKQSCWFDGIENLSIFSGCDICMSPTPSYTLWTAGILLNGMKWLWTEPFRGFLVCATELRLDKPQRFINMQKYHPLTSPGFHRSILTQKYSQLFPLPTYRSPYYVRYQWSPLSGIAWRGFMTWRTTPSSNLSSGGVVMYTVR